MRNLNNFELVILEKLANLYPAIKSHIPFLQVEGIEITGVGMYVNFKYKIDGKHLELIAVNDGELSVEGHKIEIKNLKYGLCDVIAVKDGLIAYIELVTYGELWDGDTTGFTIEDEQ